MSQDKQFDATPRRRQQARQKGQAARSRDLTAAGVLALAVVCSPAWLGCLSRSVREGAAGALGHLHEFDPTAEGLRQLWLHWLMLYLRGLAPLLLIVVGGAVLLTFSQGGFVFSMHPLIPSFDKLNPLTSLKRTLSVTGLVEILKSLLKITLVGLVSWLVLRPHVPQLLLLGQMEPGAGMATVGKLAWELSIKASLAMVALGAADYVYQRFDHQKSLRMTREEMRQEMRETEGDPHVRAQQRQARQRLLRDGVAPGLPQATVVLTNPTHVSVALRYDKDSRAPVVVARGRGRLAARIKQLARRYGVPVYEQPPLARSLYAACPLGAEVPPALYQAVAVILAELYRAAAERRQRSRQAG
ncbi:MAG: EscU/YscU/HrcU family type III secretion system export apparatus switch protein [Armatimonadota bacterium]